MRWANPPKTDEELADIIVAMDPRKLYRGVLALGAEVSKIPFMQRMTAMVLEILGEKEAAKICREHGKAVLDLRILERKTPERMGRPGVETNNQSTGEASHIGSPCQER